MTIHRDDNDIDDGVDDRIYHDLRGIHHFDHYDLDNKLGDDDKSCVLINEMLCWARAYFVVMVKTPSQSGEGGLDLRLRERSTKRSAAGIF